RAAKVPVFQAGKVGSTPTGHSRGSANGRLAVLDTAREGSTPSPRTLLTTRCQYLRGSANGRPSGSEPENEGSIPSPRSVRRRGSRQSACLGSTSNGVRFPGRRLGSALAPRVQINSRSDLAT